MIASSGLSIVCVCCQSWKGDPLWNWNPCLLEVRVALKLDPPQEQEESGAVPAARLLRR